MGAISQHSLLRGGYLIDSIMVYLSFVSHWGLRFVHDKADRDEVSD
jgi:hypothetical protein